MRSKPCHKLVRSFFEVSLTVDPLLTFRLLTSVKRAGAVFVPHYPPLMATLCLSTLTLPTEEAPYWIRVPRSPAILLVSGMAY